MMIGKNFTCRNRSLQNLPLAAFQFNFMMSEVQYVILLVKWYMIPWITVTYSGEPVYQYVGKLGINFELLVLRPCMPKLITLVQER